MNIFITAFSQKYEYKAMSFVNTDFSNVQRKVDENLAKENLSIIGQKRNDDYLAQPIEE